MSGRFTVFGCIAGALQWERITGLLAKRKTVVFKGIVGAGRVHYQTVRAIEATRRVATREIHYHIFCRRKFNTIYYRKSLKQISRMELRATKTVSPTIASACLELTLAVRLFDCIKANDTIISSWTFLWSTCSINHI